MVGSRRCYCGCRPGRPDSVLRIGEARDVVAAIQIVQFGRSKVDCLALTRALFSVDNFWKRGGAANSPCSPSCHPWRGSVRRGRHHYRGGESGKQGCRRGHRSQCTVGGKTWSYLEWLSSVTWLSELTLAQACPTLASTEIQCTELSTALSLACC